MPPLTDEELNALLQTLQYSQNYGMFPDVLAGAAGDDGVGRTTQAQLLDPELLASIGLFGPAQIASGLEERLSSAARKALEDWEEEGFTLQQKIDAERVSQQPPVFINEIKNRYQSNPTVWNIVGSFFDQIEKGTTSAEAVKEVFDESLPIDQWTVPKAEGGPGLSPEVAAVIGKEELSLNDLLLNAGVLESDIRRLKNDLSAFENDASTFRSQKLQWETNVDDSDLIDLLSQKAIWKQGPKGIDVSQERLDYFKDIGVPGLALLPDPTERYQFTTEDIRQMRKPTQRGTELSLLESMIQERSKPAAASSELQMKALRDVERAERERQVRSALPPRREPTEAEQAVVAQIAKPFSRFYDVGPAPDMAPTPLRRQGGYRAPSYSEDLARMLLEEERILAGRAAREGERMASQGRTPFLDAMRQTQAYGRMVG